MKASNQYDILVIGGGINGCGIARDAAGRGYSVCLCEAGDLAGGTSSASTKLIHGGLRYLEHYEFRLVREALIEREILLRMAPHIVSPMRFVLPHHEGLRPRWLLRAGLFLYDHLGGRKALAPTQTMDLRRHPAGAALKNQYRKGFAYSDCWVDDARLVVLVAQDASRRGAEINVRTRVLNAESAGAGWNVRLGLSDGSRREVQAKLIVNAAGPWVDEVLRRVFGDAQARNVRLVRGSHIVVRRKLPTAHAYILQNSDGRIIFAIPYLSGFTLIGTTDCDDPEWNGSTEITQAEIDYLCEQASAYLDVPLSREDIVWTYSGVRPLYDDGATAAQEATRDYVIKRGTRHGQAPLLNVFGGKITTFRCLAESALEEIGALLGKKGRPWTARSSLPGGAFEAERISQVIADLRGAYPFLTEAHAQRLVRAYGTTARDILGDATSLAALGPQISGDLYEAELVHLIRNEWATGADDVLFRRTKLGVAMTMEERRQARSRIDRYLSRTAAAHAGEEGA